MKKLLRGILIALALIVVVIAGLHRAFLTAFHPSQEMTYRQIDDIELSLQVFAPAGQATEPRPAILFFYGGSWTTGSTGQFFPWAKQFASRGWVAFTADYRVHSRHGTNAFAAVDDARAAYQFLRDNADMFAIDPDKILLGGGSAGGHLAAAVTIPGNAGGDDIPLPAGLILFNPTLDTKFETEDRIAALFEGRGEDISPRHHIRPGLPPTFIAHGTADGMVPFEQSREFCERMTAAGNRCVLKAFEGAGHGFFNWGLGYFDEVLAQAVLFAQELR